MADVQGADRYFAMAPEVVPEVKSPDANSRVQICETFEGSGFSKLNCILPVTLNGKRALHRLK
jgi:hypothetical protein